ncbi:MAG: PrsW family intramembrane metalloprotease [Candidatus Hydrogenedentes bacterium]|nr:PrsW family intramembrane metalloprotease [Candidatus Hydrogenedentota bacterium]
MEYAIALALAIVPSWLLVRYFHERDLYPEPAGIIWGTFALGALTTIPVVIVALPLMQLLPQPESVVGTGFQFAFLYAAIPEEFFKLTVLLFYSLRRREFDEPMDGLVYGAVAAQGFAALENSLYSFSVGPAMTIVRGFTAVPAHACMGIIMGYYVGRARFEPERRSALIFQGYIFATLAHGLYDAPLLTINAITTRFGGVPPEYETFTATCTILGLLVLIVTMAFARALWKKAKHDQLHHPVPPALPEAAIVVHPASIASPPSIRTVTLTPRPVQSMPVSVLKVLFGIVFSIAGGAIVFACIHAFLDPDTDKRLYVNLGFMLVILGWTPLLLGLRIFRSGVRGLNVPQLPSGPAT